MNILIIHCSFIYTGGGERIVLEQIDHLTRRGNKVLCYTPVLDTKNCFPDIIKKYQIKTFLPQLPRWFPIRHAIVMLLSCIITPLYAFKFKNVDIIIGENQPGAWIAYVLSVLTKKPYIVYLNHPNRMIYPRDNEDWASIKDFKLLSYLFFLFKPVLKILDNISIKNAKQRLVNGIFIGKEIEKIYNISWMACPSGAIRIKEYKDREENKSGKITINGRTIDRPFILFTGRHQKWKRIDWLVEIGSIISKQHQDFYILIPGSSTPYTEVLKRLTKKLHAQSYVLFLGRITQEELRKLYLQASAYAFPSEKEDFGIVIIEAMGHGVPVVAWNVGGPTDSVVDHKTGYLIEPYDKEKFAQALLSILTNNKLQNSLGRNAVEHIAKNFSWTRHTNILEQELKKAVVVKHKKV